MSVDIDVVFTDYTLGREEALRAIGEDLLVSKSLISKMGYRASLPTSKSGDDVKLLVEAPDARVKVEVNFVFRGTVLPTVRARLCDRAQHLFTTDIEVPMLETAELYGSKLVAAMDRQHPRDMFDVIKMREQHELDGAIIDCFVAYLAGHNRPVHEILFPRTLPLEPTFTNEFEGMTLEPIQKRWRLCPLIASLALSMFHSLPRLMRMSDLSSIGMGRWHRGRADSPTGPMPDTF